MWCLMLFMIYEFVVVTRKHDGRGKKIKGFFFVKEKSDLQIFFLLLEILAKKKDKQNK